MKLGDAKSAATEATCEEDRQNRREFFNGLGKWSMIVVAAVSFLRGSTADAQTGHKEDPPPEIDPERPAWSASDDGNQRMKMAGYFKARPRPPHENHSDYYRHYIRGPIHTNNVIQ
jgi:hypothetical protein